MAVAMLKNNEKYPFNDSIFYFKVLIGQGKIQDSVHKYIKDQLDINKEDMKKTGGDKNMGHVEELFNFALNILLYTTSKDPDIRTQMPRDFQTEIGRKKSSKKQNKLIHRAQNSCSFPTLIVGSTIKDAGESQIVQNAGGMHKWRLSQRVYVAGHWRVQWYGSEAQGTKHSELIPIEPYLKGPEFSEVMHSVHQIGRAHGKTA